MFTKYSVISKTLRALGSYRRNYAVAKSAWTTRAINYTMQRSNVEGMGGGFMTTPLPINNHDLMRRQLSSSNIGIVDYAVVKELPKHPDTLLIDVREPQELQETGQIPTSINIPLDIVSQELTIDEGTFKAKYGRNKPKENTEIIFHCKIGRRSQNAAETATKLGYRNVKNYVGSWLDWAEHENLPK